MATDPPLRFVVPAAGRWDDLIGVEHPPSADELAPRIIDAVDAWVVHSYLRLRTRGVRATLSTSFDPNAINVTSRRGLSMTAPLWRSFIVCAQHDRPRPALCDVRIVQNKASLRDDDDFYLPHWPQPGLKPRDPARGVTVRRLTFKGVGDNLAPRYRDDAFRERLRAIGAELATSDRPDAMSRKGDIDWTDYREADLVLAVREMHPAKLDTKPPSKLINAWLAGTPALLGRESAYLQLRESDLDYIEVSSPKEVIAAIQRFRENPSLYRAMVEHGKRRAEAFTPDATTDRWIELLTGPVAERFERWRSAGRVARLAAHPARLWRHEANVRAHRRAQRRPR